MATDHQTLPVSPYSSLTGALEYPSTTISSSRKKSTGSVHKSRTSTTPYIVPSQYHNDDPQHKKRSRSSSQTQALASTSRSARQCPSQDFYQAQKLTGHAVVPPPSGPTNHVILPQEEYFEERDKMWRYGPRSQPITFQSRNIPELGVRIGKTAHCQVVDIEGANDLVFADSSYREIQVWVLWPGYSSHPLRRRIKTQGGGIARHILLTVISHTILDFTFGIYNKKIPVERGHEKWMIGSKADGNTIVGGELFITRLVHRGGSNWQVEIWTPARRH
ncbi:hypothetical protein H0H87_008825 [Tephrocybe sp. NHM501043]|nr:hypothetical protein H0H87_008825 [Tephrocybe sp. NHM501043]